MTTKTSTTGNTIDPQGIDHPGHYNSHESGVEAIEICRHMNFNLGSALKYVLRRGEKVEAGMTPAQATIKDLKKALWYVADHNKYEGRAAEIIPAPVQEVARRLVLCEPSPDIARLLNALIMADGGSAPSAARAQDWLEAMIAELEEESS